MRKKKYNSLKCILPLTRERWSQQLIRQKLQVFQSYVTNRRDVEETSESVGILGGEDVEQSHTTV